MMSVQISQTSVQISAGTMRIDLQGNSSFSDLGFLCCIEMPFDSLRRSFFKRFYLLNQPGNPGECGNLSICSPFDFFEHLLDALPRLRFGQTFTCELLIEFFTIEVDARYQSPCIFIHE